MMQFSNIPKFEAAKSQLLNISTSNRVPNSLLLTCSDGGAGLYLALELAKHMVCDKPSKLGACNSCIACRQFSSFNYPDLHFSFPFNKTESKGKDANSLSLRPQFVEELIKSPFLSHERWLSALNIANKQAAITVGEAKSINHILSMKSFSSKPRVIILWQPELLNQSAANKLLKLIEEPGENVHFFLVSHRPEAVLKTILSRCVAFKVPSLTNAELLDAFKEHSIDQSRLNSLLINSNGSLGLALDSLNSFDKAETSQKTLVSWLRAIYTARPSSIIEVSDTISAMYREDIKAFLDFASAVFRQAMLFKTQESNVSAFNYKEFSLDRFAPFIATENSDAIIGIIESCRTDISRNANSKVTILDTSLQLTKYISKA